MRTQIRRDRKTTHSGQMLDRQLNAERSRMHPNGIANTERQREESRLGRERQAEAKAASRVLRSERRAAKKALRSRG